MSYGWFKLHHDLIGDVKIRRFSPQEKWAWVVLLSLASMNKVRGEIHADDEDISDYCEFKTEQDWLYYRDKLVAKGMVEFTESGRLRIVNWDRRQFEKPSDRSEAVKARVDKHRRLKKQESNANETPCNANETPCNANETPQIQIQIKTTDPDPDPDPDPEKEGDPEGAIAPSEPEPSPTPPASRQSQDQSALSNGSVMVELKVVGSAPPRDRVAERFAAQGHKHPAMVAVGLGDAWVGPAFSDFAPGVLKEAIAHLRKHELPHELADAKRLVSNLVRREDWAGLEILRDKAIANAPKVSSETPSADLSQYPIAPDFRRWGYDDPRHEALVHLVRNNGRSTDQLGVLYAEYRQWVLSNPVWHKYPDEPKNYQLPEVG
ncbi:hypothetical protein [Thermoleptolyngbya sp. M55_K2018_002]|uniref:hypothetical protein n=1 Tax=Thermoleptolyngbya sp. M55_K2018_002 TaxID=2747808 RepID=UPI0019E12347|nr:hypothetical protein [Thermoleptolyngbya sp. M55_K2018_002]HIK42134.1 hypothetical protein [Thermoleptolyngbya sp. M55_K2018_002]